VFKHRFFLSTSEALASYPPVPLTERSLGGTDGEALTIKAEQIARIEYLEEGDAE
jgi:hypothetical protein